MAASCLPAASHCSDIARSSGEFMVCGYAVTLRSGSHIRWCGGYPGDGGYLRTGLRDASCNGCRVAFVVEASTVIAEDATAGVEVACIERLGVNEAFATFAEQGGASSSRPRRRLKAMWASSSKSGGTKHAYRVPASGLQASSRLVGFSHCQTRPSTLRPARQEGWADPSHGRPPDGRQKFLPGC